MRFTDLDSSNYSRIFKELKFIDIFSLAIVKPIFYDVARATFRPRYWHFNFNSEFKSANIEKLELFFAGFGDLPTALTLENKFNDKLSKSRTLLAIASTHEPNRIRPLTMLKLKNFCEIDQHLILLGPVMRDLQTLCLENVELPFRLSIFLYLSPQLVHLRLIGCQFNHAYERFPNDIILSPLMVELRTLYLKSNKYLRIDEIVDQLFRFPNLTRFNNIDNIEITE